MSIDLTSEILSAHADQLNHGKPSSSPVNGGLLSDQRDDLNALMHIATRAKRALTPVPMAAAFRARLRDGLTMAAQHKESQSVLLGRREPVWDWVIGAAAIGSAAGLIAIAWRARRPQPAESRVAPELDSSRVGLES